MTVYIVTETPGQPGHKDVVSAHHWQWALGHIDTAERAWMGPGAGDDIGPSGLTYIALTREDFDTLAEMFAAPDRYDSPQTKGVMMLSEPPK